MRESYRDLFAVRILATLRCQLFHHPDHRAGSFFIPLEKEVNKQPQISYIRKVP